MRGDVVLELGEPGTSDDGAHGTGGVVDRDHRGGDALGIGLGPHVRREGGVVRPLRGRLSGDIERGVDAQPATEDHGVPLLVGGTEPGVGEELLLDLLDEVAVGRRLFDDTALRRTRTAHVGAPSGRQGRLDVVEHLRPGDHTVGDHPLESEATLFLGLLGEQDRIVLHGVGDERSEERAVDPRQLGRRLPPVGLGGGLHPVGAVPEVDGVQVQLEDLVLLQLSLETDGECGLLRLAIEDAVIAEECLLHQLLGDGRSALLDLTGLHVLDQRAHQAAQVDAAMLVELCVLDREDRLFHCVGHLRQRDGFTVLGAVERGQQIAVGGEDLRAHREITEGGDVDVTVGTLDGTGDADHRREQDHHREGDDETSGHDRGPELYELPHRE